MICNNYNLISLLDNNIRSTLKRIQNNKTLIVYGRFNLKTPYQDELLHQATALDSNMLQRDFLSLLKAQLITRNFFLHIKELNQIACLNCKFYIIYKKRSSKKSKFNPDSNFSFEEIIRIESNYIKGFYLSCLHEL